MNQLDMGETRTWQALHGGGFSLNIGQWEIFISPNKPPYGWNAMIISFNHVVHRLNRDTLEQAKRAGLDFLVDILGEWKVLAEEAREMLPKS